MHEIISPNHYNTDIFIVTKKTSPSNIRNLQKLDLPIRIENSKPISLARKLCLLKTTKDFVLFIDDDVFVSDIVFEQLSKQMKSDVGAVEGIPLVRGFGKWFDNSINKYHVRCELKKGERGFTIITLVRKSLALDWAPPLLTSYEDYALSQHILSKGFKWIKIPVSAIHLKSWKKITQNLLWAGNGWKQFFKQKLNDRIKVSIEYSISPFTMFIRDKDPFLFLYRIYFNWLFAFIILL